MVKKGKTELANLRLARQLIIGIMAVMVQMVVQAKTAKTESRLDRVEMLL